MSIFLFVWLLLLSSAVQAQTYLSLEGGALWQGLNDQAVPGDSGTRFSIADFKQGPFASYRIYLGYQFSERHQIRFLYAPLELTVHGQFNKTISFNNANFLANTAATAFYKFNSYRVTYACSIEDLQSWKLSLGFTAKVRDAEVRLTQGSTTVSKSNIGFVPLFHIDGKTAVFSDLLFRFDFDGLVAPQGRAVDLGIFLETQLIYDQTFLFAGYRTIEGGADNDKVYNFAWLHILTLGLRTEF